MESLYEHFGYSTNVTSILPGKDRHQKTIKTDKEEKTCDRYPDAPLYGVELEVACNHSVKDIIDAQDKKPFFICKKDTSITGNGFGRYEFVTRPMDFRSQRIRWGRFFSKFLEEGGGYRGFDTTVDTNNGMHIHIGREAFTPEHIQRFAWFIVDPVNYPFILAMSERGVSLGGYAETPSFGRLSRRDAFREVMKHCSRRGAIYVTGSKPTYEVRLFKGIVSYPSLVKNLEFVDSLFHFTMHSSYSNTTVDAYITWLGTQPANKYKMLRKFISRINKKVFLDIKLHLRLFHIKTVDEAITFSKKRGVVITDDMLKFLNKKIRASSGGRSFPLSLEKGKLIRNPKLFSKLIDQEEDSLKHFIDKAA